MPCFTLFDGGRVDNVLVVSTRTVTCVTASSRALLPLLNVAVDPQHARFNPWEKNMIQLLHSTVRSKIVSVNVSYVTYVTECPTAHALQSVGEVHDSAAALDRAQQACLRLHDHGRAPGLPSFIRKELYGKVHQVRHLFCKELYGKVHQVVIPYVSRML